MPIFAASLCFLSSLILIINGRDVVNLGLGVLFLVSGFGLLKRRQWARILGLTASLVTLLQFCKTIWTLTAGGAGRQMGLAGAPTMLLSLLGAIATIVALFAIWRSLHEPRPTENPE